MRLDLSLAAVAACCEVQTESLRCWLLGDNRAIDGLLGKNTQQRTLEEIVVDKVMQQQPGSHASPCDTCKS